MHRNSLFLVLGIALISQISSVDAASPFLNIPTSCGPDSSSSYVPVAGSAQILLSVLAEGSNAAAELRGITGHPLTSLQFDTSALFGLLGSDPNLEVVAAVEDRFHRISYVRVNANNATHQKLSNGYTRCVFSRTQLTGFSNVVLLWVNCFNPNFTEFPPGPNNIFVTNFVGNGVRLNNYTTRTNNTACDIPAAQE